MVAERPVQHFPDSFSIKAVGLDADDFADFVVSVVREAVDPESAVEQRTRASRRGKYLSVTVTFVATSQAQLDGVFLRVSQQPRVMWTL